MALSSMLTYQTVKYVRVRDARLGAMYYFFLFCTFAYVVVYVIVYNQRYMLFEAPTGTARLNVMAPSKVYRASGGAGLPYCVGGTPKKGQLANKGHTQWPCQFRDECSAPRFPTQQQQQQQCRRVPPTHAGCSHAAAQCHRPACPHLDPGLWAMQVLRRVPAGRAG